MPREIAEFLVFVCVFGIAACVIQLLGDDKRRRLWRDAASRLEWDVVQILVLLRRLGLRLRR
jgi:hypothetical protein